MLVDSAYMPPSADPSTQDLAETIDTLSKISIAAGHFILTFVWGSDRKLRQENTHAFQASGAAYPQWGDGWVFEPAFQIVHADGNTSCDLRVANVEQNGNQTRISLKDSVYELYVDLYFVAVPAYNVIETWSVVRNLESGVVQLQAIASSSLLLSGEDLRLTQFCGDWANEANMETETLRSGIKILDSKLAVRAHQFRAPWFLLSNGELCEDRGEVLAGSLAWSGSFKFSFEKLPTGELCAIAGVNPFASTWHLAAGEELTAPTMVWAWSDSGSGDVSRNLHRYVRSEVLRDGDRLRPILLNNWEATYFSFDEPKLESLFKGAKDMGIDLFLLDDGWFGNKYPRNDDTQGLGDWQTNIKKLPNGIETVVEKAIESGVRFGLWFEPEMVNPGSELFENHPDWVISQESRELELQRNQLALDLSNPEVQEFAFKVVDDVLQAAPGISYIKWDCNRYLTQPGSRYLAADRQTHLQIAYTEGLYKVMSRLEEAHPNVEIMMCSGGGGRVDFGALRFAHELWPSDMTDPVKRIFIQWGYSHFIPAIATAAHVTSWGERPLKFAFDVAMSGRLGLDIDVDNLSDSDKAFCRSAIENYRKLREVVQLGDLYRLESPYSGKRASLMYVLGQQALVFAFSSEGAGSANLKLKGLASEATYQVIETNLATPDVSLGSFTGTDLMSTGISVTEMAPLSSRVFILNKV